MVPTGQEKLGKARDFMLSGKCQGKMLFLKNQGKWSWIMQTADICDFLSPNSKKHPNLRLPLNIQKLEVFQLQGALLLCSPRPGPLLFAYCSINTVSFICDIMYHFWHLCNRVIVSIRSGNVITWLESQGILLQKTCRNHVLLHYCFIVAL